MPQIDWERIRFENLIKREGSEKLDKIKMPENLVNISCRFCSTQLKNDSKKIEFEHLEVCGKYTSSVERGITKNVLITSRGYLSTVVLIHTPRGEVRFTGLRVINKRKLDNTSGKKIIENIVNVINEVNSDEQTSNAINFFTYQRFIQIDVSKFQKIDYIFSNNENYYRKVSKMNCAIKDSIGVDDFNNFTDLELLDIFKKLIWIERYNLSTAKERMKLEKKLDIPSPKPGSSIRIQNFIGEVKLIKNWDKGYKLTLIDQFNQERIFLMLDLLF